MSCKILSLGLSVFLGCAFASAQSPAPVDDPLKPLRELKIDGGEITLLKRDDSPTLTNAEGQVVRTDLPPRTIVKAVLHPAKGSNIKVEVWLPDANKWNSRLLGLGNGGSAGNINSGGFAGPLAGGYAVVSTDMGTSPNSDSGVGNKEVWKDFGFRATHLMTVLAKQLITAYYGKGPDYSYFNGGSTGGQQALQEAQRYPEDYDGIVSAIPAHCRTPLHAYFLWNAQVIKKCPFSKEQETNVIEAGNEYMAARETPPVAGKFISDTRYDSKDIEGVIAIAMKKDSTLTQAHAEALRKLFDGPRHEVTGERIFNGIPFGCTMSNTQGHLYLFRWAFGADKNMDDINFGADIDAYTAALGPYLNAENPDLTPFEKRGGKLIMTSGSADPVVPTHATLDYYERVIEHFGSLEKTQSFFRFYIIPGMAHSGGPGLHPAANLVGLVQNWREKGVAPEMIPGRRDANGKPELEMPIYPYPTKTGWDATTSKFIPIDGPRGGVEHVAVRFRPEAAQ